MADPQRFERCFILINSQLPSPRWLRINNWSLTGELNTVHIVPNDACYRNTCQRIWQWMCDSNTRSFYTLRFSKPLQSASLPIHCTCLKLITGFHYRIHHDRLWGHRPTQQALHNSWTKATNQCRSLSSFRYWNCTR